MMSEADVKLLHEQIVSVIKTVYDPEIPVDIFELGLIYSIGIDPEANVRVIMTLTTPNCPSAAELPQEVEDKVKTLSKVNDVVVEITFDPPWDKSLMSEEALVELGLL